MRYNQEKAWKGAFQLFPWVSFLTYAVVTAVTPGPNNILSMSNGSRRGFRGALPFNFGILAGFTVVMTLCAVLCSLLTAALPKIQKPMQWIGAAYLVYLAWGTFRSGGVEGKDVKGSFWQGLLLQFVNPKIYLYGIMSMEAYILPHYQGQILPLFGFSMLLAQIGFVFTLCWSAFGSVFRRLFSRHAKMVNAVMAVALCYCAVSLLLA